MGTRVAYGGISIVVNIHVMAYQGTMGSKGRKQTAESDTHWTRVGLSDFLFQISRESETLRTLPSASPRRGFEITLAPRLFRSLQIFLHILYIHSMIEMTDFNACGCRSVYIEGLLLRKDESTNSKAYHCKANLHSD